LVDLVNDGRSIGKLVSERVLWPKTCYKKRKERSKTAAVDVRYITAYFVANENSASIS
jgi:hypothetical protein